VSYCHLSSIEREEIAYLLALGKSLCAIARQINRSHTSIAREIKRNKPVWEVHLRQTITYDNGTENAYHEKTNTRLKTQSYFCLPYHSWEKGTVEQVNGLIRRFLPKKTDFAKIDEKQLKRIEKFLNHRPRKCLEYQIPYEAFRNMSGALSG